MPGRSGIFRWVDRLLLLLGLLLVVFVVWAFFFNGPPHEREMRGRVGTACPAAHPACDFANIAAFSDDIFVQGKQHA